MWIAPWPPAHLLWASAHASSFHRSPGSLAAINISQGETLYQQHCSACHGADGRGEGPRAASLPAWPPDLGSGLLWRRGEGDLFHAVQYGVRDHRGRATMPGLGAELDATQTWAVLDWLQARAAGSQLAREGSWVDPVHVPDAEVSCEQQLPLRRLSSWRGQRLRLVLVGERSAPVQEDARFVTVAVPVPTQEPAHVPGLAPAITTPAHALPVSWTSPTRAPAQAQAQCRAQGDDLARALALIAAVPLPQLAGMQFIVDRQGSLRARAAAGAPGWSSADLVCRAGGTADSVTTTAMAMADGLDGLVSRMDAEPVRYLRGGLPH